MKLSGWIILEGRAPACYDSRFPIFWIKKIAKIVAQEQCLEYTIKKVTVLVEEK